MAVLCQAIVSLSSLIKPTFSGYNAILLMNTIFHTSNSVSYHRDCPKKVNPPIAVGIVKFPIPTNHPICPERNIPHPGGGDVTHSTGSNIKIS